MKAKQVYILLIVIFSTIILGTLVYFYDYLGGNEEIEIYELGDKERVIIGKPFAGIQTSQQIEDLFTDARTLVSEGVLKGELAMVNYKNDTLENNELSFFIGISIENDMAEIPDGYEVRKFQTPQAYAVFLSMHPLVRPAPDTIEEMLEGQAETNKKELKNFFIEIHYPDNSLSVEAWTK